MNDPVGDTARSILDGHVTLSRRLASAGHFPTVEVLDSVSRVAGAVTTPHQRELGIELRRFMAAYEEARDLIEIGAYREGSNPVVDRAIELRERIVAFCRQGMHDLASAEESWAALEAVLA
jgi:flagellum-specific ATP synthase